MLKIEGIGSIGDIKEDGAVLKSTIMTFNNYMKDGKEVNNAEFWNVVLIGEAKEALRNCRKGDTIELSGFIKNPYNYDKKTSYCSISVLGAKVIDPVEKNKMELFVSGRGKTSDIEDKGNYLSTTLHTHEKYTPKEGGEEKYHNMFWNLALTGKSKKALGECQKGDLIEIKKAKINNSISDKDKRTYYNISVYNAEKVRQEKTPETPSAPKSSRKK